MSIGQFCEWVISIKDTEYDTDRNDFIIGYFCNCNPNGDDKKSYLVNFISDKKPENVAYSFESLEKLKSMLLLRSFFNIFAIIYSFSMHYLLNIDKIFHEQFTGWVSGRQNKHTIYKHKIYF